MPRPPPYRSTATRANRTAAVRFFTVAALLDRRRTVGLHPLTRAAQHYAAIDTPHRRQTLRAAHTRPSKHQSLAIRANAQATSHSSSPAVLVSTCRPPSVKSRRHVIRNLKSTAECGYLTAYGVSVSSGISSLAISGADCRCIQNARALFGRSPIPVTTATNQTMPWCRKGHDVVDSCRRRH